MADRVVGDLDMRRKSSRSFHDKRRMWVGNDIGDRVSSTRSESDSDNEEGSEGLSAAFVTFLRGVYY